MTPWRRLALSAKLSLAAHLLAGLAMLVVLRRGLQTNPDLADRLEFLARHRWAWSAAWLTWTAAGASVLLFYACYAKAHEEEVGPLGWAALAAGVLAVILDWTSQGLFVFVLPGLARRGLTASFLILQRRAVLLTGGAANALYTLAAALLLWPTRDAYPRGTVRAGWGVVLFGAGLIAASALDSTAGMFWSNAGLVPCVILWLWGIARTAEREETAA